MSNLSNDSKINEMCNAMLKSGRWTLARHSKHTIIHHLAEGATKSISIPSTPSDIRAYANFRRDYNRYLRDFFIHTGVILTAPSKREQPHISRKYNTEHSEDQIQNQN